MTDAAGKGGGHIPAGYILWITVNRYVALFTYLLQVQFFLNADMSRECKLIYSFLCFLKSAFILGLFIVLRLFHVCS